MRLFSVLLIIHIAGGALALLSGPVAIGARKGGRLHRRAGLVFAWSMGTSTAVGFPLALVIHSDLLLMISVFTFYLIWCGVMAIRRRRGRVAVPVLDYGMPALTAAFSVWLIDQAFTSGVGAGVQTTRVFFGLLGLITAAREIHALRGTATHWLRYHIGNMLGAYIATTTAFLVVNVSFVDPAVLFIAPTVAGVPLIVWMMRRHAPGKPRGSAPGPGWG